MQPITVALGLTMTALALAALLAGPSFAYLAPHTRVLLSQYWPAFTAYGALALVSLVVALYATARAAGLADLGRKVDLVERSIRRGDGRRSGAGRTDATAGPWRLQRMTHPQPSHGECPMRPQPRYWCTALAVLITVGIVAEARVFAQGVSPWLNAVDVLQQAFTGPLARGLSLIAIVIGGLMFAFGEGGSKKALAGIIFGLGMAMGAANFLTWLFS